ncbi:unnamed protein product [Phytophthora fragariaefolia]|uniref:Unnamed protein product n=1 Tax=Phytophthora fragariaefolia TaxID=1490495 RepID=A0A9W7CZJ1_9STRA|nr:unnamed protein product [Phytophthora fragariaefolia]
MCLYFRLDGGVLLGVGVYVDDLLVTGTKQAAVDTFFGELTSLSVKDLGCAHKFLGMRILYDDLGGYSLDQEVMITDLLKEHGMEHAHGVRTPIGEDSNECARKDAVLLSSIRNDCLGLSIASGQPAMASEVHEAGYSFCRSQGNAKLDRMVGCSDADFAADKQDRKSVTGGFITIDGMVVAWICRKQGGVALSTMEAEYTAASVVSQEIMGLREMLNELGVPLMVPMPLRIDNQAAIQQLCGERASSKAKHIDTRIKFVNHFAKSGVLLPEYCEGKSMPADSLTKALSTPRLRDRRGMLGLS